MKKIKVKVYEPDVKIIKSNGYVLKFDKKQAKYLDGFLPIINVNELEDGRCLVATSVINKNDEVVVPIRFCNVSKEDLDNFELGININLYPNGKSIYEHNGYCYLIDLNKVKFNDDLTPTTYIFKLNCVYALGNGKMICYLPKKAFIYDVVNNELKSDFYNYISEPDKDGCFNAFDSINNEMVSPLIIRSRINKDFKVVNKFCLNEETFVILGDVNIPKSKRTRYLDDCYSEYCKQLWEDGKKCKRIIH